MRNIITGSILLGLFAAWRKLSTRYMCAEIDCPNTAAIDGGLCASCHHYYEVCEPLDPFTISEEAYPVTA